MCAGSKSIHGRLRGNDNVPLSIRARIGGTGYGSQRVVQSSIRTGKNVAGPSRHVVEDTAALWIIGTFHVEETWKDGGTVRCREVNGDDGFYLC